MYDWDYFCDVSEFHPLADANNLYDAYDKARKGSHWKGQVQKFRWNKLTEIGRLQAEMDSFVKEKPDAYKLSPYSLFTVNERGKIRAITALSIRDRVVKHVLNDVFLLPNIRPHLIYDNGASLQGRGVSFTRKRLVAHLESYFREHGTNDGYIMTLDFSGYYDNIDHEKAMDMICRYIDDDAARRLVWQAYDSYKVDVSYMSDEDYGSLQNGKFNTVAYRQDGHTASDLVGEKFLHKSLSVGDQTSQITAIAFPTPIDTLVKIVNGCRYYGRYMDDFYVIADTVEELQDLQRQIYDKADELKLIINKKKTHIVKLKNTFTFLQFKYYLRENGHVVVRINPKTVTRMRRKMKRLARLTNNGDVRLDKIESLFMSWIANYRQYMSKKQVGNIVSLYQNLYGKGLDQWMKSKNII